MCMGGTPTIQPPAPAPAPPPPPPPPAVEQTAPVQPANDPTRVENKRTSGRDSLRIDLTTPNTGGSSGLNIPV